MEKKKKASSFLRQDLFAHPTEREKKEEESERVDERRGSEEIKIKEKEERERGRKKEREKHMDEATEDTRTYSFFMSPFKQVLHSANIVVVKCSCLPCR